MNERLPVLSPDSPIIMAGLTNREQFRVADRAYRRAHYTGLPLHQMLRSETARFERKHQLRILGADMAAAHANEAEILQQPGHEAADTVSKVPSPIPEERDGPDGEGDPAALQAIRDKTRVRTPEVATEKERAKKPSKAKAETPAEAPAATGPTQEALAVAASKAENVGKRVSWKMVGKDFAGTIKHVIPEGATPKSLGIEAGTDKPRTGHSYVVEIEGTGKLSWPMLNTLAMLD